MHAGSMVALFVALVAACAPAYAGPNAGGMLVLHHDSSLAYSAEEAYCGAAVLSACEDAIVRVDGDSTAVFHTFAAFPAGSQPRLSGLTFGISYDEGIHVVDYGPCGDYELPQATWPASVTGTAVTWAHAQTTQLVEIYWFAAYSSTAEPQEFSLIAHPTQGGNMVEDSVIGEIDPIAGYGRMGFGIDGLVMCPPALIPGACCFDDGSCSVLYRPECWGEHGRYSGDGTVCDPNPCPQPGACCYPDGHCVLRPQPACTGEHLGAGTVCEPNPCPPPGACCHDDGHCDLVTEMSCTGDYQGEGTLCDPNPCPPPGACCYPDGHCELVQPESCSGIYNGNGTLCDPNPCPAPLGACCFIDGHCEALSYLDCIEGEGAFQGDETICETDPCPPAGACCAADGRCSFVVAAECDDTYLGDSVVCEPNPCAVPIGACCFLTGRCEVLAEYLCADQGGAFTLDAACDPNPCEYCTPLLGDRGIARDRIAPITDLVASGVEEVGPNYGGTLVLHHNASLVYTSGGSYCGSSALPSCEDANSHVASEGISIVHVLAAFLEEPRLSGMTFGIQYDICVGIVDAASCGDFELADPAWPSSGSGTAVTWKQAQTSSLVEVYWFAAYSATVEAQEMSLVPHPGQGGWFADDSVPSRLDAIAGYGRLGFGAQGVVECPGPFEQGACCLTDGTCAILFESDCVAQAGSFFGEGTGCEPDPCENPGACCIEDACSYVSESDCERSGGTYFGGDTACTTELCSTTPTIEGTWGSIKRLFR